MQQSDQLVSQAVDALLSSADPIRELDVRTAGSLAHRLEGLVLQRLYERHDYSWDKVALALRGRRAGASIQRIRARHPELSVAPEKK